MLLRDISGLNDVGATTRSGHKCGVNDVATRYTRIMESRSLTSRFSFREPRFQIALRAALAMVVVAFIGFATLRHRIITQRDVASYLGREGCVLSYDQVHPVDDASGKQDEPGLRFHARHSLVSVTIHSLEKPDELVEQLSRIDTLKKIRIEYATSGGCAFAVGPRLAAIERIKVRFPNAAVEVRVTFIAVVG
jgi:hypothetical protein